MIFVTVGAQIPFDRLCQTIDAWAGKHTRRDIFAQIGSTTWKPKHFDYEKFLNPLDFRERLKTAAIIVAHAGMGTIITALEYGKPIIVMPRSGELHETRNNHQIATAENLRSSGRVIVAMDEAELTVKLECIDEIKGGQKIATTADPRLIAAIRSFGLGESVPAVR
jgi:UDP-N-acetylglucosamine transferase subunit ALG13